MSGADHLAKILERKALEVARRRAKIARFARIAERLPVDAERGERAARALERRAGEPLRIIAEVKFQSPSAGVIRPRATGEGTRVARGYERGGAAAVSVLADGPGFGGSPLEVRRVAGAVALPVLFKEFVIDEVQIEVARLAGASMVLLLVCALDEARLTELVRETEAKGMAPVVEAASEREMEIALRTGARIVGVNARDLRTFEVDREAARRAVELVPSERIAVYMSGIKTPEDVRAVGAGRADAALVGEGLMRRADPSEALRRLSGSAER